MCFEHLLLYNILVKVFLFVSCILNTIFTNFPCFYKTMGPKRNFSQWKYVCFCLWVNHLKRIWNVVAWYEFHQKYKQQCARKPKKKKKKSTGKSFLKQHIYFNVHFRFFFFFLLPWLPKFLRRHNTICITGRYLSRLYLIFLCHVCWKRTKQKNVKE